ncbi:MAG: NADH-quinone oxidoreductase subunit N, partial [Candidatus Methylomirabilales bacterium]
PQLDWGGMAPFLLLTVTALGTLVLDLFLSPRHRARLTYLGLAGLLLTMAVLASGFGKEERVVGGMLILDDFSRFFHLVFLLIAALTILVSVKYAEREGIQQGEYYTLILFATLGMMVMASATDLIMIFLGLEALSIPLYILSGFLRGQLRANESALKYLLLGAFASAFLLYGIAFLYGAAGSTRLERIAAHLSQGTASDSPLVILGIGLLLVGLAFKVAAVPFHMWLPDVYEGAPTPITAFMIAGTKAAAFSALLRAFGTALTPLHAEWSSPLWIIALLTMGVGNVAALTQQSIKRMLAYSSIAHAGYLLVALVAGTSRGFSSILFYLVVYAFMNLGAFAVIIALARQGEESPTLSSYTGLGFRQPVLAFSMAVFMFSLAGLPPTGGFMGKFYIFSAAVEADYIGLVIVAVLCSLISVFFYLRVVVVMYMEESREGHPNLVVSPALLITLFLTAAATLQMGVLPAGVWDLAVRSVRVLWG